MVRNHLEALTASIHLHSITMVDQGGKRVSGHGHDQVLTVSARHSCSALCEAVFRVGRVEHDNRNWIGSVTVLPYRLYGIVEQCTRSGPLPVG